MINGLKHSRNGFIKNINIKFREGPTRFCLFWKSSYLWLPLTQIWDIIKFFSFLQISQLFPWDCQSQFYYAHIIILLLSIRLEWVDTVTTIFRSVWIQLKTENWKLKIEKYCSKIIFKCVNSIIEHIFNEKITEK